MLQYRNPVYPQYFADPYAWEHEGTYYAIGTSPSAAGERGIPLLRSPDLVHWEARPNALVRPDASLGSDFWAPETAFDGQDFYMYYSVGAGDTGHHVRVARSAGPEGPYRDVGRVTDTAHPFAIDAHAFKDVDGQWYLFYARDFLEQDAGEDLGTALVVSRMEGMTRLVGDERVVLRSLQAWQLYQASRPMYGQVFDWHTLEGPCVRRHEGRYYCFYSGGRWENDTYGVDYGIADTVMGPYLDAGNENGPRVLRSRPGEVIGPGHNSIVVAPDGRDFFVYHAWDVDMSARRMFIDPLVWGPDGPRCQGPTFGGG